MNYSNKLPLPKDILWLGRLSKPFPATRDDVINSARKWHYRGVALNFLKQFPKNATFNTRLEFMAKCEALIGHIRKDKVSSRIKFTNSLNKEQS